MYKDAEIITERIYNLAIIIKYYCATAKEGENEASKISTLAGYLHKDADELVKLLH